jgi:mono/diheme cytochrome c family protein
MSERRGWILWTSLLFAGAVLCRSAAAADDNACVAWGKELFLNHCAACHGEGGGGNGPLASSLKTAPSDLTLITKTHDNRYPREWVEGFIEGGKTIGSHGKREMPVWGKVFESTSPLGKAGAKAAISALTDYIATIQK